MAPLAPLPRYSSMECSCASFSRGKARAARRDEKVKEHSVAEDVSEICLSLGRKRFFPGFSLEGGYP